MKTSKCAVITLTYNNQVHIAKWAACLKNQTLSPAQIILVDTGSQDISYLAHYEMMKNLQIIYAPKESGFCKGNNIGYSYIEADIEYVLFLNPDAYLSDNFIEKAIKIMQEPQNSTCGALTGQLQSYDITKDAPTGFFDSTGIFSTPYGKWYDRDQGKPCKGHIFMAQELIPAICGACFFSRKSALNTVMLRGSEVFDNSFYMYKEDIDLSVRLNAKKWKLLFVPDLVAYHCRGWQKNRQKMPKPMRVHSARNELTLHRRKKQLLPLIYSTCKYLAVKFLNI